MIIFYSYNYTTGISKTVISAGLLKISILYILDLISRLSPFFSSNMFVIDAVSGFASQCWLFVCFCCRCGAWVFWGFGGCCFLFCRFFLVG